MNSILMMLREQCAADPARMDACALQGEKETLTYRELIRRVELLAMTLAIQGVRVLALDAANSPAWVVADLACQRAGAVLLPLPPFFTAAQIRHCVEEAGADMLLTDAQTRPDYLHSDDGVVMREPITGLLQYRLRNTPSTGIPQGTSKITFTSGSTGAPKGVCLDTATQYRVASAIAARIALNEPVHLCVLPLATLLENVGGVYVALLSGGSVVLKPADKLGFAGASFDAATFTRGLTTTAPTSCILIPELLAALNIATAAGWRAPESLRFVAVGGARVAPENVIRARAAGIPVYEGYGLSECASVVSLNAPGEDVPGSVGKPLSHVDVSTHDGELIVHGNGFLGYLNDPASWYPASVATGDLVRIDSSGFLYVHGRKRNVLITSYGRNVSPEWVESEVLANPMIAQCVVLGDGEPHLVALIAARYAGVSDTVIDEWIAQCNAQLPPYARIASWIRLRNPMTPDSGLWTANGRPRREAIAAHYAPQLQTHFHPVPHSMSMASLASRH